jgi:hypothetical protein
LLDDRSVREPGDDAHCLRDVRPAARAPRRKRHAHDEAVAEVDHGLGRVCDLRAGPHVTPVPDELEPALASVVVLADVDGVDTNDVEIDAAIEEQQDDIVVGRFSSTSTTARSHASSTTSTASARSPTSRSRLMERHLKTSTDR